MHKQEADQDDAYKTELRNLQIQLTCLQRGVIEARRQVLVILEGRDAAGKDGTIKRITEHLSPRDTRVVALGKPENHENRLWYFQRWVAELPAKGEITLFNRSWYNRAGVETVMGFCTQAEYQAFLKIAPHFEHVLHESGIEIIKYYLDISKDGQKERLEERRADPLSQWKISPIDDTALQHWDDYTKARNAMLKTTSTPYAPWIIVRATHKKNARLNLIRDLLNRAGNGIAGIRSDKPDAKFVFEFKDVAELES